MASHPLTITDEEVRSKFPEDQDLANEMATEMIRAVVLRREEPEPPEHLRFANRPDWQEKHRRSQEALAAGNVIRHEDVADWDNLGE
jgi:hypothetical protein